MSTITRAEHTNTFFSDSVARNKIIREAKSRGFIQSKPFAFDEISFYHKYCRDVQVNIIREYVSSDPFVRVSWSSEGIKRPSIKQIELHGKAELQASKLMKTIESIINTIRLTKAGV